MWKDVCTSPLVSLEAAVIRSTWCRLLHGFILSSAAGLAGASAASLGDAAEAMKWLELASSLAQGEGRESDCD